METTAEYDCPHCGETIVMFVEPADGAVQKLVEDCQVCCRANEVTVCFDGHAKVVSTQAEAVDL